VVSGAPVLVAPDKFKRTFGAAEVAAAIAAGLRDGGREADELPVADGGDGTADALGGVLEGSDTTPVDASTADGLHLVPEAARDPWTASSAGTGELIAAAIDAGATHVVVGCGGTATMDGGKGMLEALGKPHGVRFTALCDVRTPWEHAAAVFAPQKGADPQMVKRLAKRMDALAATMKKDPRGIPLTGCGGGISGALWSELGAELVPGPSYVLDALGFDERMRRAPFVVTGEGRLDESTLAGKAVAEVATRCRQSGVWCHAVVGQNDLGRFGTRVLDLASVHEAGDLDAMRKAGRALA
jgi:glycerate kinase